MQLTTRRWRVTLYACIALLLAAAVVARDQLPGRLGAQWKGETYGKAQQMQLVVGLMQAEEDTYARERLGAMARRLDVQPGITVVAADSAGSSILPEIRTMAQRELAALGVDVGRPTSPALRATPSALAGASPDRPHLALRLPLRIVVAESPRMTLPKVLARNYVEASLTRRVLLPARDGDACTLLLTIGQGTHDALLTALAASDGVLGPCAFVSVFGMPGRVLRERLDGAQWLPAAFASWGSAPASIDSLDGAWTALSADGVRCLTRADASCADAWRATRSSTWNSRAGAAPGAVGVEPLLTAPLPWFATHGDALGDRERLLLSDLVREAGAERFGPVWRSDVSVDSAMRALVGTNEAIWMQRWLARRYVAHLASPRPVRRELIWGVLLLAGCVVGTMLSGAERRLA